MNKPHELTAHEWAEVAAVRAVLEGFGLEEDEDPAAWLPKHAYGVRFDYQTDGPGYSGPLYLLQGAGGARDQPDGVCQERAGAVGAGPDLVAGSFDSSGRP